MSWCVDRDGQRVAEWLQFRIDTCNTCTCVEGRRGVEVAMTFRGTQYFENAFKCSYSTCNWDTCPHRNGWLAKHYGPEGIKYSKIHIRLCVF